ncbi:MAG: glycoside hydrolase family 5 protein [Verrucomicrobiota bacterium]
MNNQKHTQTPARRTLLRSLVSLLALSTALTSTARAADWYLKASQGYNNSWATPVTDWTANANGTGANPASISAADTFDTNNRTVRTPAVNSDTTFSGGVLRLTGGSGAIGMKTGGTAVATVPKLVSTAGTIDAWHNGTQYFRANDWENLSAGTAYTSLKATAGRTLNVSVGKLSGGGETRLHGGGTVRLDVTDAEHYLGVIRVSSGAVDFENDIFTSGLLVIETGATVVLDQAVSFASLTVAGTEYPIGNYTLADLQAAHPGVFSGTTGGSIAVRAPRTWYLTVSQGGQNWTEAHLSNWNSAANGSGVAPTSINGYDIYLNQTNNRELRTPYTASTFTGGTLALTYGSKLVIKTYPNLVSTIPALLTSGTPQFANGSGNRQNLAIGDWDILSGTSRLVASSSRSLGLDIGWLTGSGNLQTEAGGSFFLSLADGSGYTGAINHNSGALRFESAFGTAGALNIGSSATVNLDQQVYVTALNVAGVSKPAGIHTYASLNAAHPAQFNAGAAPGLVAVYTPDTAGPVRMNGVNLSGPESNTANLPGTAGFNYVYPTEADFDYYASKGLNLIRLPFRWERLQHGLNVPLNAAQLGYLDTAVARASARGMKVILDMHNYARCKVGGTVYRFGDAQLPASAYADVWRRLADHYKDEPAIYGFDIMNEPYSMPTPTTWPEYAQAAVNAIREVNLDTWVIVEGESWANAWGFETKNPHLHNVRDPVGRLMFSAHSYWSDAGTDVYKPYDQENGANPMMGVENVKPFIDWLKKHDAHGFVGEYAVPNDDPRWLVVLDNFLAYLAQENVSGTYWAGGAWYSGSPVSCQPTSNYTVDRAVMSVLEDHP